MLLSNMLLHIAQDTHELKAGKYEVLSHLLEETTKYTIKFVTSLPVLGVLRRTQKYVAGHCFFLSRCCTTADLMKSNHNIFVIITLHWRRLQFWNILFRNLFLNCSETCSAFSGLQASAHHSQVPVVKLGGVYPLQGPSIGLYLHCSKYINII